MPDLVHQLGELFLGAVPVALIVLVFYLLLRSLFFQPLLKVMAERDARTLGAQKSAEAAQTAAAEKIRQYEEALKQARAKVYAEQEAARKKLMEERAAFLKEARAKAAAEVNAGKQGIEKEFAAAKKELQATAAQLSVEIARRVLQSPIAPAGPANEAR
jgi:F-type H+-transporting ATPase subunit b